MTLQQLQARRTRLHVYIGGHDATDFFKPDALEWEYTDNAKGKADEFRITLADINGKWSGPWKPKKGTKVVALLECFDWFGPGEHAVLKMGEFTVDELELSGPPDKVAIKAVSAAKSGQLSEGRQTKGWQYFTLKLIAAEIAKKHDLELFYDAPEVKFERIDQREESDLAFLARISKESGVNLKVHDGKLVLFSAKTWDGKKPSIAIEKRGGQFSPSSYSFSEKSEGTFKEAEVSYHDPAANETHTATVKASGEPPSGQVLKLNQRVESAAAAIALGNAKLRENNENEKTASIEVMGHPGLVAGITLSLTGWGSYDGIYFVESAKHKGAPYTTSAELRKTLNY